MNITDILKKNKKIDILSYQQGFKLAKVDFSRDIDRTRIFMNPTTKLPKEFSLGYIHAKEEFKNGRKETKI